MGGIRGKWKIDGATVAAEAAETVDAETTTSSLLLGVAAGMVETVVCGDSLRDVAAVPLRCCKGEAEVVVFVVYIGAARRTRLLLLLLPVRSGGGGTAAAAEAYATPAAEIDDVVAAATACDRVGESLLSVVVPVGL